MEENKRKNNTGIIVILVIIILALGVCVGYLLSKNSKNEKTTEVVSNTQVQEKKETTKNVSETKQDIDVKVEYKKAEYSDVEILDKLLINNKDVLNSMIEITHDSNLKLISKSISDNMAFVNIDVYGSQFDAKYLFIYDNNGKIITYYRSINDSDNDNNAYRYNGDFEYNTTNKILTFNTTLWLGEGDESTGKAFNQKSITELSKTELEKLGNYADKVKYEYKYENGKFELVKKEGLSKLKDNEFYKEYFK